MQYANLHLHSTYSDAGFTPGQLVLIGKALGYGALALTDHETDGGCKEFMRACEREGLRSVTGTEFYGMFGNWSLHLTALDFDQDEPGLRAFIDHRVQIHNDYTRKCVELGLQRGYIEGITWDDLLYYTGPGAWIGTDALLYTLRMKKAMPEQGAKFVRQMVMRDPELMQEKPAQPTAEEVIKVVRKAGGVIALAHPSSNGISAVEQLVEWGMNGIEVNHPGITPEVLPLAEEAAKRYNLYCCGGTDHTGPMSSNGGKYAIPVFNGITEEQFNILVERRLG